MTHFEMRKFKEEQEKHFYEQRCIKPNCKYCTHKNYKIKYRCLVHYGYGLCQNIHCDYCSERDQFCGYDE